MNQEVKQLWQAELRSGKYEQGPNRLKTLGTTIKHCCLGVLCELAQEAGIGSWSPEPRIYALNAVMAEFDSGHKNSHGLTEEVRQWADMTVDNENSCVTANDTQGYSFEQIADMVEVW